MLTDIPLTSILLPAIVILVAVSLFLRFRSRGESEPLIHAWKEFRISLLATGSILIFLWLALPSTPSLSTFGYPADVDRVTQPARLLSLLQDYNRALVRTTEIVHWVIFIIVWWFIASVHSFAKVLTTRLRERDSAQ
jgi:hypothetical protein